MITLSTTAQQREYLISKGITQALSPSTMEDIGAEVSWPLLAKLENEKNRLEADIALVKDKASMTRLEAVTMSIDSIFDDIEQVFKDIKTREGEASIRKAKESQLMTDAKAKILKLADELTASARQLNSVPLADLAVAVSKLSK